VSPLERFAVNLRKARTRIGISQEVLADRCDLHRTNGCEEHVIICTHEAYSKFKVGQAVL